MAEYTGDKWVQDEVNRELVAVWHKDPKESYDYYHYIAEFNQNEDGDDNDANNAQLACATVNACISINPENPLAVAKGMEDIIGALRGMVGVYYSTSGDSSPRAYEFAQQALASIERGK